MVWKYCVCSFFSMDGRILYDNTWLPTKKEAIDRLRSMRADGIRGLFILRTPRTFSVHISVSDITADITVLWCAHLDKAP